MFPPYTQNEMELVSPKTISDLRLTDHRISNKSSFKTALSLTVLSTVLLLAVLLLLSHDTIVVSNNNTEPPVLFSSIYCDEINNGGEPCEIVSRTPPQLQLPHRQHQDWIDQRQLLLREKNHQENHQQRGLDEVGIQKEQIKSELNQRAGQEEDDDNVSWSRIFLVLLVAVMLTAVLNSLFRVWRKMHEQEAGGIETELPPLETDYDEDFRVVTHDDIGIDMNVDESVDRDGDDGNDVELCGDTKASKFMTGIELT